MGADATPVTSEGRVLLSSHRHQPRILGLESQEDLAAWLTTGRHRTMSDTLSEEVVPMVSRLDANYGHWMMEYCGIVEGLLQLPRLPRVLIRAGGRPFIRESLRLLGLPESHLIEWDGRGGPRRVSPGWSYSLPGNRVAFSPRTLRWLRDRFLSGAVGGPAESHTGQGLRIYIARPRGGWRSVINDEDVCRALEAHGFRILRPEQMPLAEQVRLFADSTMIVALHGSGLTNALFARRARVLEIVGQYGDGTFYSVCSGLGLPYAAVSADPAQRDDVRVNIEVLLSAIDRLESLSQAACAEDGGKLASRSLLTS